MFDPWNCGPFSYGGDSLGVDPFGHTIFDAIRGEPGTFFDFGYRGDPVWGTNPPEPFQLLFGGRLYGDLYGATFASFDAYADWRTDIAALPESQVYAAFAAMCKNLGCDPNEAYRVGYQYGGLVWSAQMAGNQVNKNNLRGYWSDPITFLHQGNPSWYSGYFFDTAHLVGGASISAHVDPFGPLNPFHYIIQMPAMLIPSQSSGTANCSLTGGCNF
jgi:hypothetical protein